MQDLKLMGMDGDWGGGGGGGSGWGMGGTVTHEAGPCYFEVQITRGVGGHALPANLWSLSLILKPFLSKSGKDLSCFRKGGIAQASV